MRVGVFLPNWIGDVVMATPALRALRGRYAGAEIVGIMRPYVADVLAGTTWLDEELYFDPRGSDPEQRTWAVIRSLRALQPETMVLLTASLRTAAIAWASGARQRVGLARNGRGPLLTRRLSMPREGWRRVPYPALDTYLEIVQAAGCRPGSKRLELATTPDDERRCDEIWSSLGLDARRPVVTFNSSGAYGAAKLWPSEHFAKLARRIATRHEASVLVLCGPNERRIAREIASGADHPRVVSLADAPVSIGLSKASVRRSWLLVTTDSGPRHFAAAFGVPVITLFGPTHIAWSETYFDRAVHLQHEVECGPCQRRVCPLGHHRCMRDLSVERVGAEVDKVLAGEANSSAA